MLLWKSSGQVEALEYCSDRKVNRQKNTVDSSAPFVGGEG